MHFFPLCNPVRQVADSDQSDEIGYCIKIKASRVWEAFVLLRIKG